MTDQGGFTLIEVLVALAILGLATISIVTIIGDGTETAADAVAMRRAALTAQSFLDRLGKDVPLRDGQSNGDWPGGYGWQLAVAPLAGQPGPGRRALNAHQVALTVTWKRGERTGHLDFQTLLLDRSQ